MKKFLVSVFSLILFTFSFADSDREGTQIEAKVGWVFNKSFDNDFEKTDKGFEFSEVSGEWRHAGIGSIKNLELGVGFSLMYDRGETGTINDYTSIPLFFVARYNILSNNIVVPYVKGQLGYSLNFIDDAYNSKGDRVDGDMKGGLYYGVGVGAEFPVLKGVTVELLYKGVGAEFEPNDQFDSYDMDTKASKSMWSLNVGVNISCMLNPEACYTSAFSAPDVIVIPTR